MKIPAMDFRAAQDKANEFAREYCKNTPLGLGDLGDEAFEKMMHNFMRACVSAWAAGYIEARKELENAGARRPA